MMLSSEDRRRLSVRWALLALLALAVLILVPSAWAGSGGAGDTVCPPPSVPVRGKFKITHRNPSGVAATDFHFYMYQSDRPSVVVTGATAGSTSFPTVGATLDSDDNRRTPPGVGPPYHGAQVNMSGGDVKDGEKITVEVMLCMNEKNILKIKDKTWTYDGQPGAPPPRPVNPGGGGGGWRIWPPFPDGGGGGGGGAAPFDPGGGGRGAQEDNGGPGGQYVHIVSIENDSTSSCLLLKELKLLASMTYYNDIEAIDWASVDPIQNRNLEPAVIIPPLSTWRYDFITSGSYIGGHVYSQIVSRFVDCPPSPSPTEMLVDDPEDADEIAIGDHPVVVESLDTDGDGIPDSFEEEHGLDMFDDGTTDSSQGADGDPDSDQVPNIWEKDLLSDPFDGDDPPTIDPGLTFHRTLPNVVLAFGVGTVPPLPADFFGPMTDPFSGPIMFSPGPPLPPTCGETPDTNLIFEWPSAHPFLDPPSAILLDGQVVALSLASDNPIPVTAGGMMTGQFFDVQAIIHGADGMGMAQMNLLREHGLGGTGDVSVLIAPLFIFTEVGNPTNQLLFDSSQEDVIFTGQSSAFPWETLAPERDCAPCQAGFYPGQNRDQSLPIEVSDPIGPALVMSFVSSCPDSAAPSPDDILPGSDLWQSVSPTTVEFGMGTPPIPAGFFGPGSEPFEGTVTLEGSPLGGTPLCDGLSGGTDTLIERRGPARLDPTDGDDTIPVEMVALSLRSIDPIQVGPDSFFDVLVDLAPNERQAGAMTITRTHPDGGTFDCEMFIQPRFIFTKTDDPGDLRVLDTATEGYDPLRMVVVDTPWVSNTSLLGQPPCTSNFLPGVRGPLEAANIQPFDLAGVGQDLNYVPTDFIGPTSPTIAVNAGDTTTTGTTVTLSLAAYDASSAIAEMRLRNDASMWGSWRPFAPVVPWVLIDSDGVRIVSAQFRDFSRNETEPGTDTILLDTTTPESQVTTTTPMTASTTSAIRLDWRSTDGPIGSGVDTVEIFWNKDGGVFASLRVPYVGVTTEIVDTDALGGDGLYGFYSRALDNAGMLEGVPGGPDVTVDVFTDALTFRQVLDYILGVSSLSAAQVLAADVDSDGVVDINDVLALLAQP